MTVRHPNTSTYSNPHQSDSCGGEEHVDVVRTDHNGHYNKEHSTDRRDIDAGRNLSEAMREHRRGGN